MIVTTIQKGDLWYGRAFMPIIAAVGNAEITISRSGSRYIVSINRNGHVIQIMPKYGRPQTRTKTKTITWGFNLTCKERDSLAQMVNNDQTVFLCLVCGAKAFCAIKGKAAIEAMNPETGKPQQALRVQLKNGRYYLMGPRTKNVSRSPSSRSTFMNRLFQELDNNSL
jgi:hypothetical protein